MTSSIRAKTFSSIGFVPTSLILTGISNSNQQCNVFKRAKWQRRSVNSLLLGNNDRPTVQRSGRVCSWESYTFNKWLLFIYNKPNLKTQITSYFHIFTNSCLPLSLGWRDGRGCAKKRCSKNFGVAMLIFTIIFEFLLIRLNGLAPPTDKEVTQFKISPVKRWSKDDEVFCIVFRCD